jgi:hypothetical protein
MIDFLLQQIYNFINFIINLLPDGIPFSEEIIDAFITLGGYWGMFDSLVSMNALATMVGLILFAELSLYGIKFIKWLIKLIPGIG